MKVGALSILLGSESVKGLLVRKDPGAADVEAKASKLQKYINKLMDGPGRPGGKQKEEYNKAERAVCSKFRKWADCEAAADNGADLTPECDELSALLDQIPPLTEEQEEKLQYICGADQPEMEMETEEKDVTTPEYTDMPMNGTTAGGMPMKGTTAGTLTDDMMPPAGTSGATMPVDDGTSGATMPVDDGSTTDMMPPAGTSGATMPVDDGSTTDMMPPAGTPGATMPVDDGTTTDPMPPAGTPGAAPEAMLATHTTADLKSVQVVPGHFAKPVGNLVQEVPRRSNFPTDWISAAQTLSNKSETAATIKKHQDTKTRIDELRVKMHGRGQ